MAHHGLVLLYRLLAVVGVTFAATVFSSAALAGPDVLSGNWISCSDNNRTRTTGSSINLDSECLYQEIDSQAGDRFELNCQTSTADFASAQLAYSTSAFQVISSDTDSTTDNKILRADPGDAPQNTRYAVVSIFANSQATMQCSLSAPDPIAPPALQPTDTTPVTSAPSAPAAGPCVDSDNDGYGWDGLSTCRVASTQSSNPPSNQTAATTSPSSTQTTPVTPGACIDSDNDGYGWDGVGSCVVSDNSTANSTSTPPTVSPPQTTPVIRSPSINDLTDLILVTGQSNAQGEGSAVSLAVLDAPNNKVFAFTDDNGWQVADLRQHWDGPNEPRHPGVNALLFPDNIPHNNFAFHFGKSLVSLDSSRVVGFVLATAPGAGIKAWDRGTRFYNTLSNKAMTALNASNRISFDGILWHQGETDFIYNGTSDSTATQTERASPNYYTDRLYSLIYNLRQEAWFSTSKPIFICGETQSTNPDPLMIAPVNRRLMALNNDSDRYTGCVSAAGLQTSDGVHFDAAALREIGRRYATMYIDFQSR